jgi:hypothetical protein
VFNANFALGQTEATTNVATFDWHSINVLSSSIITKVEVSSVRTIVPGVTYYVQVGRGTTADNISYAPNILWNTTVSTDHFNNQPIKDYWALRFFVTRKITQPDFGAGATVASATLRIYFK